jgi:hypothetical protein
MFKWINIRIVSMYRYLHLPGEWCTYNDVFLLLPNSILFTSMEHNQSWHSCLLGLWSWNSLHLRTIHESILHSKLCQYL